MPHRLARAWLGAVLALALLAGCASSGQKATSGSEPTGPPRQGGALTMAVYGETSGWNPHYNEWGQAGAMVGSSVLEPLATSGHDLSAKPWLATSWTPNATFDTWTIALRPGVTFQDGEPFDAAAVKTNLDDAQTAPLSSVAIAGLFKAITVVDAHTVRIETVQPWASFPSSYLASQSTLMMAPKMISSSDHGQGHPVGTGPFTFTSWRSGDSFATTRNPTYWQKGLPHLDKLTFKVITDANAQAAAMQTGTVDMIFANSAHVAEQLAGQFNEIRNWTTEPGMAMTNTLPEVDGKPNPLANVHARRALAYATDRKAIAASQGKDVRSGNSPFSPDSPWGSPESENGYPNHDLAKAKAEVAEYEHDTGQSSLSFDLAGSADATTRTVMQLLQAQWKEAGIEAHIEAVEMASFITQVVGGNYQVAMFALYSFPDPDQNHFFWSSETAQGPGKVSINFTQYTTPKIDADLKVGRESNVFATRKAAYDDIVHQLNSAAVNIWTYSTPYTLISAKKVHGLAGAAVAPFGNPQPKTWLADLWLS